MVSLSISRRFGPRDESARRVTGRRPCRDRLYTTQVALQTTGHWPDVARRATCRCWWDAGVDERAASERVLWCFGVGVRRGFDALDLQNEIFKDLLVGAVIV